MNEDNQAAKQPKLLPLTPEYESDNHKVYLDAVEAALTDKDKDGILNIALTGSYGTGKSSVLQQVAKTHQKKVIQVSLSTLGIDDSDSDDSGPKSKTNQIQKEIVKQFLYSEDPAMAPGSRFRRIGRLKFRRELVTALLVGPVVALVFLLTGWSDKLAELAKPYLSPAVQVHLPLITFGAVWLVASGFTLAIRYLTHHRLRVEKVTAGPATISLTEDSTSYFDRYLDEIVYFFDVTKYDVVIFEDIDRFDDPHIFETLRALNTLLNGAKQLDSRSIRFIYAIKDSIFDELGIRAAREAGADLPETVPASAAVKQPDDDDAKLARANRTKFFDLVIPVVPFITHQSARDLMVRVLRDIEHEVSSDLIDLAARYQADMRFIKNVRNEFVIFRQKVLPTTEESLELTEDSLFAMMLYKGTHLSDFEAIRLGTSNLDRLYKASRDLVTENIANLDIEARKLRSRLAKLDSVGSRSDELGAALEQYIERSARQIKTQTRHGSSISFAGQSLTPEDLRTTEFWARFVAEEGPITVKVPGFQPSGWGNMFTVEVEITRADAAQALGDPLTLEEWMAADRAELPQRLTDIQAEREFILQADIADLIARPDLKVTQDGEGVSLAILADRYLGKNLAQQLVASGYINRDFTLYSSTYYSLRVSTRARNFLMHNVDPNVADFHFALDPDDVDAVLRERGEAVLHEHGSYNIAVLDRLLGTDDNRSDLLIGALIRPGEPGRDFVQAYLTGGSHQDTLIHRATPRWPEIFQFLVSDAEVDEAVRSQLLGAALTHTNPDVEYVVDTDVKAYFEEHYSSLAPVVDEQTDKQTAERITGLLTSMDARLATLEPLRGEVLRAVVATDRYVITHGNLVMALGDKTSLALDAIKQRNETVYSYVLANHAAYLEALNDDEPTVQANEMFVEVIEDVVDRAEDFLPAVVDGAADTCMVSDLDVTTAAWPVLALNGRFLATFANLTAYIDEVGSLDENLAALLTKSRVIQAVSDSDETAKQALASRVLAAVSELPSPELRAGLVASLDLDDYLPATSVTPEKGNLVGLLVKNEVIADDAESFDLALSQDWATREYAISQSTKFAVFMTPTEVPVHDLANLLRSASIPKPVKRAVTERIGEFTVDADRDTLKAVADYALANGLPLPYEEVVLQADAGVPAQFVVRLLEPHLPSLDPEQLARILTNMGDEYPSVAQRNGKHPKLPNTPADLALAKRLEALEIASSSSVKGDEITINMKKPTDE
ncbi:DNA-binding protein [Promicromonospora sp. NFX87]|uniref:YobI family P-loop NTPase n=1 Tax=Promicromonospora sp. NFX87 TaxID=3402691 RepID=UPI003AFA3F95